MKLSLFSLLFAGLVVSVYGSPIVIHRRNASPTVVDDAAQKLDALAAKVQVLSASINQTVASMPATTEAEKDKVAQAIVPQIKELESALDEATATINAQTKRSTADIASLDSRSQLCTDSCLTSKANGLVTMITGTVSGLVGCLGINRVTVLIKPLLTSLGGLLNCLDGLVSGLLLTVGGLLNSLLGGLGLGDLLSGLLGGLLGGGLLGGILGGGGGGLLGPGGLLP